MKTITVLALTLPLVLLAAPGCRRMPPRTPLAIAAAEGDVARTRALLETGADVDERDDDGQTAALWAARRGPPETLELLLDAGVDVDQRDSRDDFGWTLLVSAVHSGRPETIDALLERGADVGLPGADGLTPLMAAVEKCYHDDATRGAIVERLLAAGADPRTGPDDQSAPLTAAVANGRLPVVRALMTAHPELRLQEDGYGALARLLARLRGDDEILALVGDG